MLGGSGGHDPEAQDLEDLESLMVEEEEVGEQEASKAKLEAQARELGDMRMELEAAVASNAKSEAQGKELGSLRAEAEAGRLLRVKYVDCRRLFRTRIATCDPCRQVEAPQFVPGSPHIPHPFYHRRYDAQTRELEILRPEVHSLRSELQAAFMIGSGPSEARVSALLAQQGDARVRHETNETQARLALSYCVLKHMLRVEPSHTARPTAAPTANIALQRHRCRSHCHSALLV